MAKFADDEYQCAQCDEFYETSYEWGHPHPTTGRNWCDACIEYEGFAVCHDCKKWMSRKHVKHYIIFDLCAACFDKAAPLH